jgi:dTDP-4-amino-4,6-dideoxygalactose transaminase
MSTKSSKQSLAELAFFGGESAFKDPVHLGMPNIGNRRQYLAYVNEILNSRWLTNNGRFVQQLEEQLAAFLGVRHCILVSNGTTGIMIALRALELSGEVIVPSFTFVATAHALHWLGLTPVFCDVNPLTHNIDPRSIEMLITARTSAILGIHLWGQACAINELDSLSQRHGLSLIFDSAHAFASKSGSTYIGNFGDLEIFSFHATKFFNTFEGGAVTTNSEQLAQKVRLYRNFGFAGQDNVVSIGINGKMDELSAAMGLNLLPDVPDLLSKLRNNYRHYKKGLAAIPQLQQVQYTNLQSNNCQYIVIEINDEIDRDMVLAIMQSENIIARRYFFPGCHNMEPYRSHSASFQWDLPVTESLVRHVLCLPNNASMSFAEIDKIVEILGFVLSRFNDIQQTATTI